MESILVLEVTDGIVTKADVFAPTNEADIIEKGPNSGRYAVDVAEEYFVNECKRLNNELSEADLENLLDDGVYFHDYLCRTSNKYHTISIQIHHSDIIR